MVLPVNKAGNVWAKVGTEKAKAYVKLKSKTLKTNRRKMMRAIVNYRVNAEELAEAKAYAEKHNLPRLGGWEKQRDRAEVLRYRMAQNNGFVQLDICLENGISTKEWAEVLLNEVNSHMINSTVSRAMWEAINILTVADAEWFIDRFCE